MNDAVHVDLFNENTADGAKNFTCSPAGNFPRSESLIWQTNQYIYHVILDPLTLLLQQVIHPKL